jgi:NTE family protein
MRIGYCLSGGGVRGVAHIGALQALKENGIEADIISGASAGSIVGSLYAAGKSSEEMLDFVNQSSYMKIFKFGFPGKGLTNLSFLQDHLKKFIPHDSFENLQRQFMVAVSNLSTGKIEILDSGSLTQAVVASSSIPLVFQPVLINDNLYVDGGLMNNLPSEAIRDQCDLLIGINVMPIKEVGAEELTNVMSIGMRCFQLSVNQNMKSSSLLCDIMIVPVELHRHSPFLLKNIDKIYRIGYDAAMEQMPAILDKIKTT